MLYHHNVWIGNDAIIGANAVVTSNIPKNSIALGYLAKIIKRINDAIKKWAHV